jgi:2-polyprenyl-6-methoxyphenol hydroxylase-like FAD-dependent oxidoreductase
MESASVTTCIAGGGPAGMLLGYLLARAGVRVLVLEKHADFRRDFRGDTLHPSTLEVMAELGLADELLALPHQKLPLLRALVGNTETILADFRHLPTRYRFIAMVPQWDFLNFLAEKASQYSGFTLRMRSEVTDLVEECGRVVGLRARSSDGDLEVRCGLVVGCDGRHSVVRERAQLKRRELGAPIDVLFFRLTRRPDDPNDAFGRLDAGGALILIRRPEHWQCGYAIPKGGIDALQARGLQAFRDDIARLVPFLADRVPEIADWADIPLLSVRVDRLLRWYRPGLLCIGDAAHAMSPVGGVGINLAIQDAVAAANTLAGPLLANQVAVDDLRRIQRRRELPTRMTQRLQLLIQNAGLGPAVSHDDRAPTRMARLFARLARSTPLPRLTGRLIGLGFRPEHPRLPSQ